MDEQPAKPRQVLVGQKVPEGQIILAKGMRRVMTEPERLLWQRLRRNQILGLHFRRQQTIAGFIADLYCHQIALAIEVDGATHDAEYDNQRDIAFS